VTSMTSMTFTAAELRALAPILVLSSGALIVLLSIAFRRSHTLAASLAAATCLLALGSLLLAAPVSPRPLGSLLVVDDYALAFQALLIAASLAVTLLAHGYLASFSGPREELYVLVLLATAGGAVLAASTHFASFLLGLELLSASLYALVAYVRTKNTCLEAGLKYLILAGVSSAFLLLGMALLYAAEGSLQWTKIVSAPLLPGQDAILLRAGGALLLVGIGFKLSLAPFHLWAPDVYQGSPAPVTAFVATVSKGAVVALLFRYFGGVTRGSLGSLSLVLAAVAVLSMILGNFLALLQDNVKRLLAYSSIAHLGYLLVALLAGGALALPAAGLYLSSYVVTMLGALGVVTVLSRPGSEAESIDDYRGLFHRSPLLATLFAAMLLSLAGIPLTAGFMGKLYLLLAGVSGSQWLLVMTLVAGSVVGLYYYLRVLIVLFLPAESASVSPPRVPLAGTLVLAALGIMLLWIGVAPRVFLALFRSPLG
jgi:NADH-quinone oxidoreductase subunit N